MESELDKHIDDVYAALGGKVDRKELEKELHMFVEEYRVSIPSAKRSLVKKHGGDPDALTLGTDRNICDLGAGQSGIDVTGRVVQVNHKEVSVSGEKKSVLAGILEDSTGSVEFTIWEPGLLSVDAGDVISVRNGYTTEYRQRVQLNVSSRSKWWVREKGEGWSREPRKIKDIGANEQNVCFEGKIISISSREVETAGGKVEIHYGLIGDEEKTLRFTAWKDYGLKKGDVIRVDGAYARERNGEIQLNIGERATVNHIERKIESVARYGLPRTCTVAELRDGMGNVTVVCRVLSVSRKELERDGRKSVMYSGTVADETGKISFTGWRDFPFGEGDTVRISGAYVRSWKGIPQLKFDEKSEVSKERAEIRTDSVASYNIEALEERGGALDATVQGTVVEIRQGTGLVLRCPQCGRATRLGECRMHGAVEGQADFRVRAVLDDGTGSITVNFGREIAEKLTGLTLEEVKQTAEKAMDNGAVALAVSRKLLFSILSVRGNVNSDEFGLNMNATSYSFAEPDIRKLASELFSEITQQAGM